MPCAVGLERANEVFFEALPPRLDGADGNPLLGQSAEYFL
jgi:hypothetical protein